MRSAKNISIFAVLSDEDLLQQCATINKANVRIHCDILTFCEYLNQLSSDKLGFTVVLNEATIEQVLPLARDAHISEQTLLTPPRLYSVFVNEAWRVVTEFEKMQKPLLPLLTVFADMPSKSVNSKYRLKSDGGMT